MAMLAQRWALKHDREKEKTRLLNERKAFAWSIFFKTLHVFEAMTALKEHIESARSRADAISSNLWQTLQFPPHDWDAVSYENGELLFLIEHRELRTMQEYQQATRWLSSLVQSVRLYRDMRVELLSTVPSEMTGTEGSMIVDSSNRAAIMPRIAHLESLSDSLEAVVRVQHPQVKRLLTDYADTMKRIIGQSPELDLN